MCTGNIGQLNPSPETTETTTDSNEMKMKDPENGQAENSKEEKSFGDTTPDENQRSSWKFKLLVALSVLMLFVVLLVPGGLVAYFLIFIEKGDVQSNQTNYIETPSSLNDELVSTGEGATTKQVELTGMSELTAPWGDLGPWGDLDESPAEVSTTQSQIEKRIFSFAKFADVSAASTNLTSGGHKLTTEQPSVTTTKSSGINPAFLRFMPRPPRQ